MKKIRMMIAGTANPHVPLYLRGAGRNVEALEIVAVSDFDAVRDDEAGAGTGVSCEVDRFGGEDLADYFRLSALNEPDNRLLPGSMNGCRESCGGMIQREEKR